MVKLSLDEDAAASCSLDNSVESGEDNYSNNNYSENRYDWEKISSTPALLLGPKPLPKFRKRCRQVQRTFPFSSNESSFDQYILSADHKHVFVHSQEGIHTLQSKHIQDELFFKAPIVRSGNVIVIPSVQCMYDSIDDIARRIGLREISFSFNTVEQHFSTSHIKSRSARTAEMRSSDTKLAINLRKQDSEAKGCHAMTVSSSYLSTSPAHRFVTSAIVYCVWENKLPYFLFISDDDGGRIFVANAMEVKSSADLQIFDYIYVFHAWEVSGKASKKDVTSSPHVVAKMTVSNSLVVSSNRSKFMETEFVLFDAKEEHLAGKDKSSSNCNRTNRLTKKVISEIFRPISSLLKHNPKPKDYELDSQFEVLMQTIDESQFLDHHTNNFLPIFESAAIVVRDNGYKSSQEEPCGGWGLKFLQKSPNDTVKSGKSLTVLVPAGVHGGPATKAGGPSSLTDRWKSNGFCDCGGWDVGCPLKVIMQNDSADSGGEDCKSLELLIEGGKRGEPSSFKAVNMSKGVYAVNFDESSTLSALQSFSVAVAFVHSQAPELCPQL